MKSNIYQYTFAEFHCDENENYHNDNGPAIVWKDGSSFYYLNGKCHREDGPAAIYVTRQEEHWYFHGNKILANSLKEFQRLIKLQAFI